MTGMTCLGEEELYLPAGSLLEAVCSPEAGSFDCHDTVVVVAHPDDETIAIGGQLARMEGVRIVHVTDGAPANMKDAQVNGFSRREDYAAARRRELETAVAMAGVKPEACHLIGVPDQSAAYRLAEIASRLAELFSEFRIATVLTHAFEGGHPDHDSTAFAVRAAIHLAGRRGLPLPVVYEFPLYRMKQDQRAFQEFIPGDQVEYAIALDNETVELKRRMLAAHATQQFVLAPFITKTERFRLAAPCDFRELPNNGNVFYAQFNWGLRPSDWADLVEKASRELDLPKWL
ncbi:PIG-L family deacetylase [Chelativorans sp. AA-79]|uniref:PIG-L deacetylase family protein n=1 Tax=Chelativorans sp. AA-79 TaxID=3028735 RepID=UPI0023F6AFC9|nr:PIG-L family deacetylase [Chelativorans sp. AA-79]WEX10416.1 PIG-L family deacetylase [Chelativorans sp. AA-79]